MLSSMSLLSATPNMNVKYRKQFDSPNKRVKRKKQKINDNEGMSLQERINELFKEHQGKKPADLARFAKISRSAVSDWMNGKTKTITGENAFAVAKFFGVNPEWVQTGKGGKHGKTNYGSNIESGPEIKGKVPLISTVQAGSWCEAIDNYAPGDAEQWLPCPVSHGENTYALRVKGDSMTSPYPGQRSYPEGSIIFIDPAIQITNGCRVVAKLPDSDDVTFKEYREDSGKRYLKPLNPQYQIQEINDSTRLCGVVIGSFVPE